MATLSPKGRIDLDCVEAEIVRLKRLWSGQTDDGLGILTGVLDADALSAVDPFDRVQLAETIRVCRTSRSLSEAGRTLFAASRVRRSTANDADRLRKYLARFGLDWATVSQI
jgi:transcriptional regulatory protein RtcR